MMKIRYTLLLYCFVGLTVHAQVRLPDSAEYGIIMHIAEETKAEYAPDKRTALFELQLLDNNSPVRYEVVTTEAEALPAFRRRLADKHISETKIAINLLPDSSVSDNVSGVVNLSVANLRVQPRN